MRLNKRFSKKIQIGEDLHGIIVKGNVAVTIHWSDSSETWNKEAELNNSWFCEKNWLEGLSNPCKTLQEEAKDEIS